MPTFRVTLSVSADAVVEVDDEDADDAADEAKHTVEMGLKLDEGDLENVEVDVITIVEAS